MLTKEFICFKKTFFVEKYTRSYYNVHIPFREKKIMNNTVFNYQLPNTTVIFTDTLRKDAPYISENPRDHESLFVVTNGTLLYEKGKHKECIKEGQIGYIERGSVDKSSAYLCDEVSYIAVNFCFDKENTNPTLPFKTLCSHGNGYNYESLFAQALNHFLSKVSKPIFLYVKSHY